MSCKWKRVEELMIMQGPNTCEDTPFPKKDRHDSHQHIIVEENSPSSNRRPGDVDVVGLGVLVLDVRPVTEVRLVSRLLHLQDLLLDGVGSRVEDFL